MSNALFPLGRTLITPGALAACEEITYEPAKLLTRHVSGDWGDLDREDMKRNREAIVDGSRVFSSYQIGQYKFFVITESDRSVTTILLAHEY